MQGLLIKLAVHTGCEARVTCNEADEMVRANAACMEGNGRTFALMIFAIQPIFFEHTPDFVQRIVAPLLKPRDPRNHAHSLHHVEVTSLIT